jgi:uncharacterized protein YbjT (DUF2867 family)
MEGLVLTIGATGRAAGLVVPALAERGARVRALIRDEKKRDTVLQRGANEVVLGDLEDHASIERALEGVTSIFYIPPVGLKDEGLTGLALVEAAERAGVRRFVFSSVIHPTLSVLPNHDMKAPVEEALVASRLEYVLLQPTVFFQNIVPAWPKVKETGVYAEPWNVETRFSRVDYRDVAEVAARAIVDDDLVYGTFELCAEGRLDRRDVAALMSDVLGRPVEAQRTDPATLPKEMAPLRPMYAWYDEHGLLGSAVTLRALLGREPRTLRDFLAAL